MKAVTLRSRRRFHGEHGEIWRTWFSPYVLFGQYRGLATQSAKPGL
jgi:hypothetical protein